MRAETGMRALPIGEAQRGVIGDVGPEIVLGDHCEYGDFELFLSPVADGGSGPTRGWVAWGGIGLFRLELSIAW